MADGVGLSVGATNLTAVVVNRAALTRSAVVTLFPNRPLEVGLPGENPRLNADERGLVITDFVDRVGDPVGIVASDGSTHHGEVLLAEALLEMLYEVTNGRGTTDPVVVTHPAHWRPATVEALRGALSQMREFSGVAVVSDAKAAVAALHDDPGLPTSGIVAVCDFGGSGTSITLFDAANGGEPIGQTVRYTELSGDLVDQAVLTQVLGGISDAGSVDVTGTSAIGPLSRLRTQCRAAKERLSTTAATSLAAELPGHRGEVRLTRNELDEAIRQPLDDFAGALQETLDRNGSRGLAAVASTGGGARVPLITTTLSEHFGVPVITTPQPELTPAIGGGLQAARGTDELGATAMAEAVAPPTAAAAAVAATQMAPEIHGDPMGSGGSSGLAWSEADDVPDVVAPTDPYDYGGAAATDAMGGPRPQMQFEPETGPYETNKRTMPFGLLVGGLVLVLLAIALAVWFVLRNNESTPTPSSTTVSTTAPSAPPTSEGPPPPASEAPPPPPQEEPPVTQTITQAPETITQTQEPPPPPPPTSEAPPPPSSQAPPPAPESPSSASSPPRVVPTLPYETIPGLPFVPRPIQPAQP